MVDHSIRDQSRKHKALVNSREDLEVTSRLLSNKVTGVNFYLKDLANMKEVKR